MSMIRKSVVCAFVGAFAYFFPRGLVLRRWTNPHMGGHVMVPKSSITVPGDTGVKAHTHLRIFVPPLERTSVPQPSPTNCSRCPAPSLRPQLRSAVSITLFVERSLAAIPTSPLRIPMLERVLERLPSLRALTIPPRRRISRLLCSVWAAQRICRGISHRNGA